MGGRAAGTALLGLLLLLTAGAFDAEALYVPGVGLVLLGAGAAVWVRLAARSAAIARTAVPGRVVEDEEVVVSLEVRAGPAGLPGAEIRDALAGGPRPLAATGEARRVVRHAATFPRRGLRRFPPPALRLADPLGLAERTVVGGGGPVEILVLPRLDTVRAVAGGGLDRAGLGRAGQAEAAIEIDGLRPYRDGAPASRIHWPTVARGGGLVERRLRAEHDARPLVVLDARAEPGPAGEAALDAAVRAAASLARALARAGGCDLLLPGERRAVPLEADLAAWPAAHARLALVEGGARPPTLRGQARRGPVLYVAARRLDRLPAPAAAIARGVTVLLVPPDAAGAAPGPPADLEVAGCRGHVLGPGGRPRGAAAEAAA